MKRTKQFLIAAIAAVLTLVGSSMAAFGAAEVGSFDDMIDGYIVGWCWDGTSPDATATVRVTVTNTQTMEVAAELTQPANIFRQDLADRGIGNGAHGFCVLADWDSLADGVYLIEGWMDGQKLANTKTYTKQTAQTALSSAGLRSLGVFRTTGYCPCYQCSEGWGRRTSSGAIARSSHTVAVDPRVIPYGSRLMIDGIIYTAEDCGGGVKGNHIDIFYDTHAQTRQHGTRRQEVFLVPAE